MIVEINKVVTFKCQFEVKKSYDGFIISIQTEDAHKCMYVTREELELISKAIIEEMKAGK